MPDPVLLYTSFGTGPYVDEIIFSAYSATLAGGRARGFRIVIFTDDPKPFASLDAEVVTIEPAVVEDWAGPRRFIFRRKLCALREALTRYGAPAAVVDGDTYFLKSPRRLLERIVPGRAVMHLPEGELGHLVALGHQRHAMAALHVKPSFGDEFRLNPRWVMWNAGVVGVHPVDVGLVDRAVSLSDAIFEAIGHKNSEQIAFGEILSRHTALQSCRDVLFHYHEWFIRDPFRPKLAKLLAEAAALPGADRAAWLYRHRPKPPLRKKLSALCKRPLKRFGLFKSDLNTST